jgi:uncharacterized membrane protein (DUF2068 family)
MEPATISGAVPKRVALPARSNEEAEPAQVHEAVLTAEDPEHARGLLLIGLFKLGKCSLAILSGFAAYHLTHVDPGELAMRLVDRLPIDPTGKLAILLMNEADSITFHSLRQLGMLSFCLAFLYLLEGTGLMLRKVWAEYLTVVMTAAAMPWEIHELLDRYTHMRLGLLLVNAGVVVYLAVLLVEKRRKDRAPLQS